MKFLNKIKRIQVHRENSLNQPTDLAEEALFVVNPVSGCSYYTFSRRLQKGDTLKLPRESLANVVT
jgi:hypothetical protein